MKLILNLAPALLDSPDAGNSQPKTPVLHKSPSKKDLLKQKKLSKRVSDLEFRLAEARKELSLALGDKNAPPVPPLPANLPPTPSTSHFWSETETSPHSAADTSQKQTTKITKKRKAASEGADYQPIPTDSDISLDSEHESKKNKKQKVVKRTSSRLSKKKPNVAKEEVVIIVPDGVTVPHIPTIPKGVDGKRATVSDDGFGGLGHEIF